jgi:hypothetical protein
VEGLLQPCFTCNYSIVFVIYCVIISVHFSSFKRLAQGTYESSCHNRLFGAFRVGEQSRWRLSESKAFSSSDLGVKSSTNSRAFSPACLLHLSAAAAAAAARGAVATVGF